MLQTFFRKKGLLSSSSDQSQLEQARQKLTAARSLLQKTKRAACVSSEVEIYGNLHSILSSNPRSLMQAIKSSKRDSVAIQKLKVGSETYTGDNVANGFYKIVTDLKTIDEDQLLQCPNYRQFLDDHKHIIEICKADRNIPPLPFLQAKKLLQNVKPSVSDL